jgi:hypothetical protein
MVIPLGRHSVKTLFPPQADATSEPGSRSALDEEMAARPVRARPDRRWPSKFKPKGTQ